VELDSKIYVAGNTGLVGSAIVRKLKADGYNNLIFTPWPDYDLRNQQQAEGFFAHERPEYVFLAAAKVGGILANSTYPAEFIYDNLMIAANIIHASHRFDVKKLLNLGSSCIYPKLAPQPLKEVYLLTGPLESMNEAYAVAKIISIKLCRYYNQQYGPGDTFDLQTSHVLPAMIRKFHEAKVGYKTEVLLWGTGQPRREFLFVDDLADAVVFLMNTKSFQDIGELVNIGTGTDLTIRELAELVKSIVGFSGKIIWNISKPDGTPQKLLDVSRMEQLGWKAKVGLKEGISITDTNFLNIK
jgi:GDP-L-fucose synthase